MLNTTWKKLKNAMEDYCKVNHLELPEFKKECIAIGFNVIRFGTSPMDNIRREEQAKAIENESKNIEIERKPVKRNKKEPEKTGTEQTENIPTQEKIERTEEKTDENKITKKKSKIRIIKK